MSLNSSNKLESSNEWITEKRFIIFMNLLLTEFEPVRILLNLFLYPDYLDCLINFCFFVILKGWGKIQKYINNNQIIVGTCQ